MPVSAPVSGLAISATEVDAPGAATVTQRKLSPIRASSRFSKPSVPVKNSTALSRSLAVGHQQSFRRSPLDTSPFTGNHAAVRWHGIGGTGWKSAAIPRRREHVPSRR